MKAQPRSIKLPPELKFFAYQLGGNNVSNGIRIAIDAYLANPTDPGKERFYEYMMVSYKADKDKIDMLYREAVKRHTTISKIIRHQLLLLYKKESTSSPDIKARVLPITKLK
ncbi:MAG: hypothetical protein QXF40_03485 [Metallosphaera sp.]